ncbi:DUF1822 family protein [Nodularia sp. UHCC 0506]|uniref:DUF1822 family protein n=1 Tax=Nodularia sp. UHCC 0506 TaxID=3110243 RepID=UPI002B1FB903|nr:DUF1822 family protein [Nodularia sp. UHCC 0506]MEA5516754.1 DUF1822 family protein [Nodularia sp. UHCC 0506]
MFEFNQLLTDNTQYLRLPISQSTQEKAWEQEQNHSNAISRHNSYLNYVSVHTLRDWFTDDLAEAETIHKPEVYPSEGSLPSIWEVVNGAAIKLDKKRIVLIPCETSDLEDFSVPQEWVDIPEWAGDYYLAIQVNLEPEEDECWIEVCGFTTHRYLKKLGKYNRNERIYTMTLDNLIQDLAVMEITLPLKRQEEIPVIPNLSEVEAKKLLDFFGDSSIYSPRLRVNDVTFDKWAALLVNDSWRQQLYERRMGKLVTSPTLVTDLRKWLQSILDSVDEIWQDYEAIFAPVKPVAVRGAIFAPVESIAVRGKNDDEPASQDAIASVIRLLQPNYSEYDRRHAAGVLGKIAVGNSDAIKALTQLLYTAQDDETRWQAAFSLGKIDPGNPQAGIKRARLIDLGVQLGGHKVALIVRIMPQANGRIRVVLKVEPSSGNKLPPNLKLSVLSESGETIPGLEVCARNNESGQIDKSYRDKEMTLDFTPPPGTQFRVKVILNELNFIHDFLV